MFAYDIVTLHKSSYTTDLEIVQDYVFVDQRHNLALFLFVYIELRLVVSFVLL